ncbi:MAG: tetratricopeptide repeat protein [Lentisphaerae bacterium]|nr:tetratricopeptide repeat protein [Lentisphaerota bacterium]
MGLLALTVLAYLPALRGGFIWDDDLHVTANETLRSLRGLYDIWFGLYRHTTCQYYPMTFTAFWIQHQLWGLNPLGYHAVNILLHGVNAVLLERLLRRLSLPLPWFAAALFAVHPVNVMSVAWITEIKNVLAGAFMLLSLLAYQRADTSLAPPFPERPLRMLSPTYAAALAWFLCALLAKTAAATLILALLLILWWRKPRLRPRDLLGVLPFAAIAGAFVSITVLVEQGYVWGTDLRLDWSPLDRWLIAARAFWLYLWHLLWPAHLAFLYPRWNVAAHTPEAWLPLVALLALLATLWRMRARFGRGPLAALLYFFLAAPALVLVQTMYMMRYTLIADHWQYFASPALFALAAAAGVRLGGRPTPPPTAPSAPRAQARSLRLSIVAPGLLILTLAAITWQQARMYRNAETLWTTTLQRNPKAWLAANNLGVIRAEAGRYEDALALYELALASDPTFPETYGNIGVALQALHRPQDAMPYFEHALRLNPDHVQSLYNLGALRLDAGRPSDAVVLLQRAAHLKRDAADIQLALAKSLKALDRMPEALDVYRRLALLRPADGAIQNDLANVLHRMGRDLDALPHYEAAIQLSPESPEPYHNKAMALLSLGRAAAAIPLFQRALAIRPDYAAARAGLAKARAGQDGIRQLTP